MLILLLDMASKVTFRFFHHQWLNSLFYPAPALFSAPYLYLISDYDETALLSCLIIILVSFNLALKPCGSVILRSF